MLLFEAEAQQQTAEVHDRILTTVMIIRVQTSPLRVWTHVSELSEGPPTTAMLPSTDSDGDGLTAPVLTSFDSCCELG